MGVEGRCPNCGKEGPVGHPCAEGVCRRREYHHIPEEYYSKVEQALPEPAEPMIGRMVGDYVVVDLLGTGGFGKVYLALQMPILMNAALKLMERGKRNPEAMQDLGRKFEREASALARLNHPNIVGLLKYGFQGVQPYMVMEFVEGGTTLKDEIHNLVVAEKGMEHGTVRHILNQILNALEASHSINIIHRDIKPENIMLQEVSGDPYFVKVLDFGLAKFTEERDHTSIMIGTPVYMAPEQVFRRDIGPWTDLYAVGIVLYELVTGKRAYSVATQRRLRDVKLDAGLEGGLDAGLDMPLMDLDRPEFVQEVDDPGVSQSPTPAEAEHHPFAGRTTQEILWLKIDPAYDPVQRLDGLGASELVKAFFRKALARNPEERFRSVGEFRTGMEGLFEELSKEEGNPLAADLKGLLDTTQRQAIEVMQSRLDKEKRELEAERRRLEADKRGHSKELERGLVQESRYSSAKQNWVVPAVYIFGSLVVMLILYMALRSAEEKIAALTGRSVNTTEESRVETPDETRSVILDASGSEPGRPVEQNGEVVVSGRTGHSPDISADDAADP